MQMTPILLDFDEPIDHDDLLKRIAFVSDITQIPLRLSHVSKTRRGSHVGIFTVSDLPPVVVVCLQALLGSDWKRETFNLSRALILGDTPAFWQSRWNVLYIEKL